MIRTRSIVAVALASFALAAPLAAEPSCQLVEVRNHYDCTTERCDGGKYWKNHWKEYDYEPESEDCIDQWILMSHQYMCGC